MSQLARKWRNGAAWSVHLSPTCQAGVVLGAGLRRVLLSCPQPLSLLLPLWCFQYTGSLPDCEDRGQGEQTRLLLSQPGSQPGPLLYPLQVKGWPRTRRQDRSGHPTQVTHPRNSHPCQLTEYSLKTRSGQNVTFAEHQFCAQHQGPFLLNANNPEHKGM